MGEEDWTIKYFEKAFEMRQRLLKDQDHSGSEVLIIWS